MCCQCINRREFLGLTTAGIAGAGFAFKPSFLPDEKEEWNPDKPKVTTGKTLTVQPVLMYNIFKMKPQTSWRPWGGLHDKNDLSEEMNRISDELKLILKNSNFPLKILPLVTVQSVEEASEVRESDYDVMIIYAASGSGNILEACVSENRHNIIFVRHRSGPIYQWYEIVHNRFLRKGGKEFELNDYRNPGGTDIYDVVVDDYNGILWRLRALYGVKNFIGSSIVALGGGGGWSCPPAPELAMEKFKIDIKNVSYEELEKRIKTAGADRKLVSLAEKWTEQYLSLPYTTLETNKQFVTNAFLLYGIFKDLMLDYNSQAFTIRSCMSTVIPIAETTACLPLSLINDEGYLAFCESDFNVIPSGILLHYISGKPVFLNDPTYPHDGIVTAAHCTAPRRMDGKNYDPAKIVTHFESDYGATPKVELAKGEKLTMICPDCTQKKWLGFKGTIESSPSYDICRSQYDINIEGDWEKLIEDVRGFHWMMALGDCTKEMKYAVRKIGLDWLDVS